ncbi:hypothetical protein [Gilliamella sp. ESL0254]|uniref:hypothetical protein n=1 Tax=Gilliamella sp. ESL0254 TaxID=2705035 RepID=UPI0015809560|nr:hypothetical protein [Gilliamella sp. ESL0254]NUF26940.1 hypothetical protein [Gilliamella sp. ESL0254]
MTISFILWRVVPIVVAVVVLVIYFKCDEDYFVNKGKVVITFLSKHFRPLTPEEMAKMAKINDQLSKNEDPMAPDGIIFQEILRQTNQSSVREMDDFNAMNNSNSDYGRFE